MPLPSRRTTSATLQWVFSPMQAVDHVHAVLLEPARPGDVVRLVEAGLDLHERRDLLAVLGRPGERPDERAVAAGAVERLLDGEDVRVFGGLLDEADDRLERLVGVVQQQSPLAITPTMESRPREARADTIGATGSTRSSGRGSCVGQRRSGPRAAAGRRTR